jgi:hypothetical protein
MPVFSCTSFRPPRKYTENPKQVRKVSELPPITSVRALDLPEHDVSPILAPEPEKHIAAVFKHSRRRDIRQRLKKLEIGSKKSTLTSEDDWSRYCAVAARHGMPRKPGWTEQTLGASEIAVPVISDVLRDLTSQRKELHRVAEELKRVLIAEGALDEEEDVRSKIARHNCEQAQALMPGIAERIRHVPERDLINFFEDVETSVTLDLGKT